MSRKLKRSADSETVASGNDGIKKRSVLCSRVESVRIGQSKVGTTAFCPHCESMLTLKTYKTQDVIL